MFKRIDHIELLTAMPERTVSFYTGALGFHERVEVMFYPEAKEIAARSTELHLGWQCLALEVDNMDVALAALRQHGVSATWGPFVRPDYARAEIRDPDGNPIELRQWFRR